MSSKLMKNHIYINSIDRTTESTSATDFSIDLGTARYIKQVIIKSVSLNKRGIYNINSGNNTFVYEIGGTEYSVSLPVGWYSDFQLRNDLQALVQITHSSFFITENTLTNKLTFSSTLMYSMRLSSSIEKSPLSYLLGISNGTEEENSFYPTIPTTSSFEGLYVFDAHKHLKCFHIASKILSSNNNSIRKDGILDNIILTIGNPNVETNFDTLQYKSEDNENDIIEYSRPINIQYTDIKLLDANFNPLLDTTCDISIELQGYERSGFTF